MLINVICDTLSGNTRVTAGEENAGESGKELGEVFV